MPEVVDTWRRSSHLGKGQKRPRRERSVGWQKKHPCRVAMTKKGRKGDVLVKKLHKGRWTGDVRTSIQNRRGGTKVTTLMGPSNFGNQNPSGSRAANLHPSSHHKLKRIRSEKREGEVSTVKNLQVPERKRYGKI